MEGRNEGLKPRAPDGSRSFHLKDLGFLFFIFSPKNQNARLPTLPRHGKRIVGRRSRCAARLQEGVRTGKATGERAWIMIRKRCSHGKQKHVCKVCNPCPHGKVKRNCAECNACPHGKLKGNCAVCNPCPHGKRKSACVKCNPCPHGNRKQNCAACKSSRTFHPSSPVIKETPSLKEEPDIKQEPEMEEGYDTGD